jgi:hypothetical protein
MRLRNNKIYREELNTKEKNYNYINLDKYLLVFMYFLFFVTFGLSYFKIYDQSSITPIEFLKSYYDNIYNYQNYKISSFSFQ